jgi:hypothetical protein
VKRFFEVKYAANAGAPQAAVVGLAEIGVDVTAGLGAGVIAHGYSWGYYENSGEILYNNGAVAYGAVFTTLDLIGILFDPIVGTLTWYLNGVSQGLYTNAALIGFTGFPAASAASGSANKLTYTLRCSLADIVGPIPAGSIAWDASVIPPGASGSLFGVM